MIKISSMPQQFRYSLITVIVCSLMLFALSCNSVQSAVTSERAVTRQLLPTGLFLRVGIVQFPPLTILKKDANGTITDRQGINILLFDSLAKALNITFSYVDVRDEDLAKYGSNPACFRLVLEGKADIAAMASLLTPDLYQLMDFIHAPLTVTQLRFAVPFPEEESQLLAPIRPFQPTVWLCFAVTLIATAPILRGLCAAYDCFIDPDPTRTPFEPKIYKKRIADYGMYLASTLLNQGNWTPPRQQSFRLAVGAWLLSAFVMVYAYSSIYVASLTVPKLQPIINSLQDLASSPSWGFLSEEHSLTSRIYMGATNGTYKLIGDKVRKDPHSKFIGLRDAFKKMESLRYVMLVSDPVGYPFIYSSYKAAGNKCRFTLSQPLPQLIVSYHFYTTKNSIFTKAIDTKWRILRESGIMDLWGKWYRPRIDECLLETRRTAYVRQRTLVMKDFYSAFLVLGIGISVSFLCWLLEQSLSYCKRLNHLKTNMVVPFDD